MSFHSRLRIAASLAVALFFSLASPLTRAQTQSSPNMGSVSSTATGTGTILAQYNVLTAQVQSTSVYFTFHVPYQSANVRVNVVNTPNSPVPLDYVALFDQNVRGLSISQSPSRNHTVSALVRTGYYRIIIGPQYRQPGLISFTVTVTVQNAQPAPPPPPPAGLRPNMCSPIGNLGTVGNGSMVRSGINIGPGEFECYNFTVGPSQLFSRFLTITFSGLPATGTKTFSLYSKKTGRFLIQGQNFYVQSYYIRQLLGDGEYQMILVAGADGRDRSNYGFVLQ